MTGLPVEPSVAPVRGPARIGEALRRHRGRVERLQWAAVAAYALLVAAPVLAPDSRATGAAGLVLWGLAWPLAILGVAVVGRAWCGLLCPEGTLTEFASRHGAGRTIPRWMRWPGWPLAGFAAFTVAGQLADVVHRPAAALALFGATLLAALAVGATVGRGARVWCRYLCPVTGVLALLARLSPLAFRTDEAAWKRHAGPAVRVDCAPLLNLRQLRSAAECHACGRCSGHRGAIAWAVRSPQQEILAPGRDDPGAAAMLLFGLLGVAAAALQWSTSPLYAAWRAALAPLVPALPAALPAWLLAPSLAPLDGIAMPLYVAAHALAVGGLAALALRGAARLLGMDPAGRFSLTLALLPVAAAGLAVGLSWQAQRLLGAGAAPAADAARVALLALACAWSLALGRRIVRATGAGAAKAGTSLAVYTLAVALAAAGWVLAG